MVLEKKETTVAYRCPSCGAGVMSLVGAFALSADMMRLKCSCGQSEMTIVYGSDKRVRMTVPCLFCSTPHHFTLSGSMFFGREVFAFACPYTGMDICFIGGRGAVGAALEKSEKELLELLGDTDPEEFLKLKADTFTDPQVYDVVNFVVRDLEEEGKIHCFCGDGEGDYRVMIVDGAIRVICARCGAMKEFPADSIASANDFLNADSLFLI